MITAIVRVQAKPGMGPAIEEDFRQWAAVVKEKEPGTLLYTLNKSRDEPDVYYAVEQYTDAAAMQVHMDNFQARGGGGGEPPFVGPMDIKVLDRVG